MVIGHIFDSITTNPYWNLAADEFFLREVDSKEKGPIIRFWRNEPSVVVGKSQSIVDEVNIPFCKEHGISIMRRITGGGAVYHDPGVLNVSFVIPREKIGRDIGVSEMNLFFTSSLLDALSRTGCQDVEIKGNTNILQHGRKISGGAAYHKVKAILHHATFLISADLGHLNSSLKASKELPLTVSGSRYMETSNLEPIDESILKENVISVISTRVNVHFSPAGLSEKGKRAITKLSQEKYDTREWVFGKD